MNSRGRSKMWLIGSNSVCVEDGGIIGRFEAPALPSTWKVKDVAPGSIAFRRHAHEDAAGS